MHGVGGGGERTEEGEEGAGENNGRCVATPRSHAPLSFHRRRHGMLFENARMFTRSINGGEARRVRWRVYHAVHQQIGAR